jgi:hypothetical protein
LGDRLSAAVLARVSITLAVPTPLPKLNVSTSDAPLMIPTNDAPAAEDVLTSALAAAGVSPTSSETSGAKLAILLMSF